MGRRMSLADMQEIGELPSGYRCIDGRIMRHDPQRDDPELETDIGECPICSGQGCDDDEG